MDCQRQNILISFFGFDKYDKNALQIGVSNYWLLITLPATAEFDGRSNISNAASQMKFDGLA